MHESGHVQPIPFQQLIRQFILAGDSEGSDDIFSDELWTFERDFGDVAGGKIDLCEKSLN